MNISLILILITILVLPFMVKHVEHNLEIFLFVMGLFTTTITGVLSLDLFTHIFNNEMLYFITGAVLIAGLIFKYTVFEIRHAVERIIKIVPLPAFIFLLITILGLISSIISAIITALILVEVVQTMPINKIYKIKICIIACFSIGLGAALTPIGEPLATIVVSELNEDFFYLIRTIGVYIIIGIMITGILGAIYIGKDARVSNISEPFHQNSKKDLESNFVIITRSFKIFLFVVALELLGAGFRPFIEMYIINQNNMLIYWINTLSAVLDNATLAAAEISPLMSEKQVTSVLMAIVVSGGMLIPGNIPNIITASKLNISSKEWAKLGIPIGFLLLSMYFVELFITNFLG